MCVPLHNISIVLPTCRLIEGQKIIDITDKGGFPVGGVKRTQFDPYMYRISGGNCFALICVHLYLRVVIFHQETSAF